jgi:hypothetical protein
LCIGQLSVGTVRPMSVNLLQQSPIDHALGDLMVANAGVTRLIEFKRERNASEKEETKRTILSRALLGDPHMQEISREIHWYIETSEAVTSFVSRVVPYLDFADPRVKATTIEQFTASVAAEAVAKEVGAETQAAYERYVNLVAVSHGGLQGASGGLIVNYSEEHGLRYVLVADIRDLLLDHRLVREAYFERVRQQVMELNREQAVRARGRTLKKERNYDASTLGL